MDWYRTLASRVLKDRLDGTAVPAAPWSGNRTLRMHDPSWEPILSSPLNTLLETPLWERSSRRGFGYAQWDAIAAMGNTKLSVTSVMDQKNRDKVAAKREPGFNEWWLSYVKGRVSRREVIPEKYHMNIRGTSDGKVLLDVAHSLTHARMDPHVDKLNEVYLHGRYAFEFMQAVAELFVAYVYGIPVDPFPGKLTSLPYGLYVYPEVHTGFEDDPPEARMPVPVGNTIQVADDVLAVVCVAIDIGPDPVCITGGRENPLRDWWSYQPVSATIVGWESALWLAGQEVRAGKKLGGSDCPKLEYVAPANDLLPPVVLDDYVEGARAYEAIPERFGKNFAEVVEKASEHTCFFPCNTCFVRNPYIDDGLRTPYGPRPQTWKDKDFPEWKPYRDKMRKAFEAVDKAKRRYYGSNYQQDRAARALRCKEVRRESIRRLRRKRNL